MKTTNWALLESTSISGPTAFMASIASVKNSPWAFDLGIGRALFTLTSLQLPGFMSFA